MPSQCPGKESSGEDVESFVPDSSSIADDVPIGKQILQMIWIVHTWADFCLPWKKFEKQTKVWPLQTEQKVETFFCLKCDIEIHFSLNIRGANPGILKSWDRIENPILKTSEYVSKNKIHIFYGINIWFFFF